VTTDHPRPFLFGLCSVAFIGGLDGFSKLQSFDSTSTKATEHTEAIGPAEATEAATA